MNRGIAALFGLFLALSASVAAEPVHWKAVLMTGYASDDEGNLLKNWDNAREGVHRLLLNRRVSPYDIRVLTADEALVGTVVHETRLELTSKAALARALKSLGLRQGEGLVLFLTSHGEPDAGFSLEYDGYDPYTVLTPRELETMLEDSLGDLPAVILISSCFSGQFLEPGGIRGPRRVIFTSARSDRSSFGCGEGTAMPEWDESVLRIWSSLSPGFAWTDLSRKLVADVSWKEFANPGDDRSFPQSAVGSAVNFPGF